MSHRGIVGSHVSLSAKSALQGATPALARSETPPGLRYVAIESAPRRRPLARFHRALRRAEDGRGKARILFYGDSHVACDFLTGRVRDALQARFGDAGPGFVIAGKPWRSYRHDRIGVQVEGEPRASRIRARTTETPPLGLAGVALESAGAPLRVQLSTRSVDDGALRGELFFLKRPGGGRLSMSADGVRLGSVRTRSSRARAGYHRFVLTGSGAHRVALKSGEGADVTLFGVSLERDASGVVLDTLGIPGARARAQLSWDAALLREHVRRRAPDLVVLAYGTNEAGDDHEPIAAYERDLVQVVARMRAMAKDASCLLVGPTDRIARTPDGGRRTLPRTAELIAVQRRVAREHGCGFFDLVGAMGGPMAMQRWASAEPPFGAADGVHLTRRGYVALGDVLTRALLEGMSEDAAD